MTNLFFFEDARIAQSVASSWRQGGVDVVAASDDSQVDACLDEFTVTSVLVPARSAEAWLSIEDKVGSRISVPRIVIVSSERRARQWTTQIARECGFDNFIVVDRSAPSHVMADVISTAVRDCTTSGTRRLERLHDLAVSPTLDEITADDIVNLEILGLMSFGRTYEEIAASVFLAPQTIRNRISQMLKRAGVRNRTELMITYQQLTARSRLMSTSPLVVALSDIASHVPI